MRTYTDEKYILLSIQPYFANKIFEGTKTVELRRSVPKYHKNQIVILYVSNPVKAIVGGFQFSHVFEGELDILWNNVKDIAGVTYEQFINYYSGANNGYGIFINKVWKYENPLTLKELRNSLTNFTPPQNFRYLCNSQAESLNLLSFEHSTQILHKQSNFSIQSYYSCLSQSY